MAFDGDVWEVCKYWSDPGIGGEADCYIDYSSREQTEDQKRIVEYLKGCVDIKSNILHVGVGSSQLAGYLYKSVNLIDGITVSDNEYFVASDKCILNYNVYQFSKHSREFVLQIKNKYDYIVDNNPASFACCRYHFYLMLDNYLWALKPGGCILTDELGLGWSCCDPDFVLNYQRLLDFQERLPIEVKKITDSVISIAKNPGIGARPLLEKSYRLCHRGGREVIEPRLV